jgi:ATP-binding cassette subfamily B protein
MQDGYIFSDTILRNIVTGDEEIDTIKLENAVQTANIKFFIEGLPLNYNTKIGSSGIDISGGQKQRILIARAVYKNPDYVFLDEATSALDAENEKIIHNNLNNFFKNKNVVIIAHRLSTVKNADQIIVLENGKIVEVGNHQSLTKKKGKYFELVKNQLFTPVSSDIIWKIPALTATFRRTALSGLQFLVTLFNAFDVSQ